MSHLRHQPTFVLPKAASSFLEQLRPTHRPSTFGADKTALVRWYRWAESQHINTEVLTRADVVGFCIMLSEQKLAPATRGNYLIFLRHYLRYLADNGQFANDPEAMIRRADIPKTGDTPSASACAQC